MCQDPYTATNIQTEIITKVFIGIGQVGGMNSRVTERVKVKPPGRRRGAYCALHIWLVTLGAYCVLHIWLVTLGAYCVLQIQLETPGRALFALDMIGVIFKQKG